jgi:hypothetical protein
MLDDQLEEPGMLTCGDELSLAAIAKVAGHCATFIMYGCQYWWRYRGGAGKVLLHRLAAPARSGYVPDRVSNSPDRLS